MKLSKSIKKKLESLTEEKKEFLEKLEKKIGIKFKNKAILLNACLHASYANEQKLPINNEKLEFLGDAVLSLVISDFLYKKTQADGEGALARAKSIIASEDSLARCAENLGLNEFLLLGKGASKEERGKKSNLADFLEAIIGAIYLEKGFRTVKKFIEDHLLLSPEKIDFIKHDPKSALQELLVKKYHHQPKYRLISVSGPPHDRQFEVAVYLRDKMIGKGKGSSKKEAEKNAAMDALTRLGLYDGSKKQAP